MGHPSTETLTPFTFEPLFLTDEALRPLFVPVLKATFDLRPRGAPALSRKPAAGALSRRVSIHRRPSCEPFIGLMARRHDRVKASPLNG